MNIRGKLTECFVVNFFFHVILSLYCDSVYADNKHRNGPTENVGGFIAGTMVHTRSGPDTIQSIRINTRLKSFSQKTGEIVESRVTKVHVFYVPKVVKLAIGTSKKLYINPDHRFYVPISQKWIAAKDLEIGTELLTSKGEKVPLLEKELIGGREKLYDLTVEGTENYFVGDQAILVHNFAFVIPIVTWVIGEGLVWVTAATVAATIGTFVVANEISKRSDNKQSGTIDGGSRTSSQCNRYSDCGARPQYSTNQAQAPGIPTAGDGFTPAKNWDGKSKVKAPNNRGYGYPDKKGNVWVPTGPDIILFSRWFTLGRTKTRRWL